MLHVPRIHRRTRTGFTLVELLVVIAIIGILVSLLLPAVQAAREAGRRTQCANHLKQLGLAMLECHDAHSHFPSGGWGYYVVGDPDRGSGMKQPGGWCFSILPYLEEQALYEIGRGLSVAAKAAASPKRLQTPVPQFHCPSRRDAKAYPHLAPTPYNSDPITTAARTDYSANANYTSDPFIVAGPNPIALGDGPTYPWPSNLQATYGITGICFLRSEIGIPNILDGTSHTLMIGEKYLMTEHYDTGTNFSDNETMYSGFDNDNHSSAELSFPAQQDTPGLNMYESFGSASTGAFQAVFCDGSVHGINYDLDPTTFAHLGNRSDGKVIDSTSW